jgi:hypothetical protein
VITTGDTAMTTSTMRPAARPRTHGKRITMFRRHLRLVVASGAALVALAATAASPVSAQVPTARVRMAHFSPDAPPTDVYITGFDGSQHLVLPGLGYGQVSEYLPLEAGDYTFSMRPAGASIDTTAVVTSSAHIEADAAYTFEALGQLSSISSTVLDDDLSSPPAGQARVRVIQAAASTPLVDVSVQTGQVLANQAVFASATGYAPVPAGSINVELSAAVSDPPTVEQLDLDAGTVNSLVVLDGTAGHPLRLVKVVDATGMGAAGSTQALPSGGIQTGGGGTAPHPSPAPMLPLAAVAGFLALMAAATVVATRRVRAI